MGTHGRTDTLAVCSPWFSPLTVSSDVDRSQDTLEITVDMLGEIPRKVLFITKKAKA